jgi:hypothetical protein
LKTVLGVRKQTSNFACRLETCREPMIIYILNTSHESLTLMIRKFYTVHLLQIVNYIMIIINHVYQIFIKRTIGLKFDNFKTETIDFTRKLKEYYHVKDIDKLEKIGKKEIDSKLYFYTSIRLVGTLPPDYLKINVLKKDKLIITKFRLSDHILNIERERYTKPKTKREERYYPFCNSVENEKHFILDCSKYSDERKQLMNSFQHIGVNPINVNHIMNPTNIAEAYSLINCIRKSLKIRNENL